MKIIAHRANLTGPELDTENSPRQIEKCIGLGFDVEIDLRIVGQQYFLGHDEPQYLVTLDWLREHKDYLWVHCKNLDALDKMQQLNEFNFFWHQNDDYTLTSHGFIWAYPGKPLTKNSVCVLPEWENKDFDKRDFNCYGICTDYVLS